METNKQLSSVEDVKTFSAYSGIQGFEAAQRMATALSKSSVIPKEYINNVPNVLVALEMAHRIGVSPLMVMQNLYIIHGKPSWSSSFIISALNSCGRFKPLRFVFEGEKKTDSYGCRAYTFDKETDERIDGVLVTWKMVKTEGWLNKKGSKWATMPELMFQYRAASFFGRLYAPDILTGMHTVEENTDISVVSDKGAIQLEKQENLLSELQNLYDECMYHLSNEDVERIGSIIREKEHLSYQKAIEHLNLKLKENEQ